MKILQNRCYTLEVTIQFISDCDSVVLFCSCEVGIVYFVGIYQFLFCKMLKKM